MSVEIVNFGCRLNALEAEAVKRAATVAGLEQTVIVNSCAVTVEAVRQAKQAVRRLKREDPQRHIIVTGCAAQTEPATFAAMAEVARVVGNADKIRPATWRAAQQALAGVPFDFGVSAEEKAVVSDIFSVRETALHLLEDQADGIGGRTRAFVQIQNGCDHRCTFCIIPFGRGPSRSVPMGEVVNQVRRLVETGYREVVLTGVDLTSWGMGLPGTPRLGQLVRSLLRHVPELKRLRLSSIDSIEVDEDLVTALAEEERLMPHLHLSLQAGDDLILKRMKRRHQRGDAIAMCDRLRRLRPDLVFGADIIAGFPTETEAHFRNSMRLVDECGLTFLHVFPFSARPGTPAARMPQVPGDEIKERARRLREKGGIALHRHLSSEVGQRKSVLVEANGIARTASFTPVRLVRPLPQGAIAEIRIAGHDGARLLAA